MSKIECGHWINGAEVPSESGEDFEVFCPCTGNLIGHAARGNSTDMESAIAAANKAFVSPVWSEVEPAQRGRWLWKLAGLLDRDRDRLARILSLEVGKPIRNGYDEIEASIRYCEYNGGMADKLGGREIPQPGRAIAYTRREPIGVVGHIIPWNYPLDMFFRGVAPCLAAGNTVVVKPAEDTPFIAIEAAKLAQEAGIPDGVINVITGFGKEAGAALTGSPDLQGIAFCGSAATGGEVMGNAGKNIIPVVSMELGGKSPCLVLPGADIEAAARGAGGGMVYNAGQSCMAKSRLIVPRDQMAAATEFCRQSMTGIKMGYSQDDPEMGPLINRKQLERVKLYVEQAVAEGAELVCGGKELDDEALKGGCFFEPTLFTNVSNSMTIAREEVFGPVLCIIPYDDEEEGLAIANDTEYGLSAMLWSGDLAQAHNVAGRMNASHITINGGGGYGIEVPFGGIGKSGFGREGGLEGLYQYTRVKSVWIPAE